MDDLLAEFLTETNENLAELDVALVRLERTPDDSQTLSLIFRLVPSARFPSGAARLLLNLLLLAAESLPAGGTIAIAGDPEAQVQVSILGLRAAWPPGLAVYLVDEERAWAALGGDSSTALRVLQAPLTTLVARTCGLRLSMLMARDAEAAPPLVFAPG